MIARFSMTRLKVSILTLGFTLLLSVGCKKNQFAPQEGDEGAQAYGTIGSTIAEEAVKLLSHTGDDFIQPTEKALSLLATDTVAKKANTNFALWQIAANSANARKGLFILRGWPEAERAAISKAMYGVAKRGADNLKILENAPAPVAHRANAAHKFFKRALNEVPKSLAHSVTQIMTKAGVRNAAAVKFGSSVSLNVSFKLQALLEKDVKDIMNTAHTRIKEMLDLHSPSHFLAKESKLPKNVIDDVLPKADSNVDDFFLMGAKSNLADEPVEAAALLHPDVTNAQLNKLDDVFDEATAKLGTTEGKRLLGCACRETAIAAAAILATSTSLAWMISDPAVQASLSKWKGVEAIAQDASCTSGTTLVKSLNAKFRIQ